MPSISEKWASLKRQLERQTHQEHEEKVKDKYVLALPVCEALFCPPSLKNEPLLWYKKKDKGTKNIEKKTNTSQPSLSVKLYPSLVCLHKDWLYRKPHFYVSSNMANCQQIVLNTAKKCRPLLKDLKMQHIFQYYHRFPTLPFHFWVLQPVYWSQEAKMVILWWNFFL